MIIFPSGIVLPSGEGLDANSPVIGYQNEVTVGNTSSTTAQTDYPVTNLANPATHTLWKGNAASATESIVIALGGAVEVDYVGIARHNFGSGAITINVETSTDVSSPTYTTVHSSIAVTDDAPLVFLLTRAAYTFIRIRLVVGATKPQAAVVYCGAALYLQRRIYVGHTPITLGRRTTAVTGKSQSGNFLGRIVVGEDRKTSVALQNLTPGWYRATFDPFVIAAKQAPFFFAWRPADYPLEVGYAWLSADPAPTNQRSNGMMQVELQLEGVV